MVLLQIPYNMTRAVGRTLVHDQYMKVLLQGKHRVNDVTDIILLIVRGNYDELFQSGKC